MKTKSPFRRHQIKRGLGRLFYQIWFNSIVCPSSIIEYKEIERAKKYGSVLVLFRFERGQMQRMEMLLRSRRR